MFSKKVTISVIVVALFFTACTFLFLPMALGRSNRPFTPEQMSLIAEKDRALRANGQGVDPNSRIDNNYKRPTLETKSFENDIRMTKQDFRDQWTKSWNADQEYLHQLEQQGGQMGASRAQEIRAEYDRGRQEIEKLPPEGKVVNIPGVETGGHSAVVSQWTWNSTSYPNYSVDPINIMWFNIGSAWDVNYVMNHWTVQTDWSGTSCGGTQWTWIFDARHVGGWDGWRQQQYQLEANGTGCILASREHVRLFGSFVRDSHAPGFNWWTVGDAHHDNWGHQSVGSWIDARGITVDSFKDWDDTPAWFVGGFWDTYFYNDGWIQGQWNDGILTYIELIA